MIFRRQTPCILAGAIAGAAVGFLGGFYGPLLVAPAANQGPLLGIFITGPIGLIGGALSGFIYWHLGRKRRRPGFCPNCMYDLHGNASGHCPECGLQVEGPRS